MADVGQSEKQPSSSTLSIGEVEFQRLQVRKKVGGHNENVAKKRYGYSVFLQNGCEIDSKHRSPASPTVRCPAFIHG